MIAVMAQPTVVDCVHPASPGIQVLWCGLRRSFRWQAPWQRPLSTHFWHLYWNRTAGASLRADGREYHLSDDRLVVVAPGTWFARRSPRPMDHWFAHVTAAIAASPGVHVLDLDGGLRRDLHAHWQALLEGQGLEPVARLLLHRIAGAGLAAGVTGPAPAQPDDRFADLLAWWRAQDWHPVAVPELARRCGMHAKAFIRSFTAAHGAPPHRWARARRLDLAAERLMQDDGDLDALAAALGFSDRGHLSRRFTERFGVPPIAYRRLARTGAVLALH